MAWGHRMLTPPARVDLPDRFAWLGARRIGSSDIAALLGLPTYADHSAWDVWERVYRRIIRDRRPTADQVRGRALEATALERYRDEVGATDLARPRAHTLWTRGEWASATPDAIRRTERIVVEAKTDRRRARWGESTTIPRWEPGVIEVVPREYYLQVAHQLYVLDLPAGDLAVLLPNEDPFEPLELRVFRILRDRELEARLVDQLSGWWDLHVRQGIPPEFDGSDAAGRYLAELDADGRRKATVAEAQLAAAYDVARRERDAWDKYRRRVGQLLCASAGKHQRLDFPAGWVTVVRNRGGSTLDEQALREAHPELAPVLAAFTRPDPPYVYPRITMEKKR